MELADRLPRRVDPRDRAQVGGQGPGRRPRTETGPRPLSHPRHPGPPVHPPGAGRRIGAADDAQSARRERCRHHQGQDGERREQAPPRPPPASPPPGEDDRGDRELRRQRQGPGERARGDQDGHAGEAGRHGQEAPRPAVAPGEDRQRQQQGEPGREQQVMAQGIGRARRPPGGPLGEGPERDRRDGDGDPAQPEAAAAGIAPRADDRRRQPEEGRQEHQTHPAGPRHRRGAPGEDDGGDQRREQEPPGGPQAPRVPPGPAVLPLGAGGRPVARAEEHQQLAGGRRDRRRAPGEAARPVAEDAAPRGEEEHEEGGGEGGSHVGILERVRMALPLGAAATAQGALHLHSQTPKSLLRRSS